MNVNTNGAVGKGVITGTGVQAATTSLRKKSSALPCPIESPDAEMWQQLKTDSGETKALWGEPKIAAYIRKVARLRSPLVLASDKKVALAAERVGCPAQCLPGFDFDPALLMSIKEAAPWFNGAYVVFTKDDVFAWAGYNLAENIGSHSSRPDGFVALWDGRTLETTLDNAIEVSDTAEHTALRFLWSVLPKLMSLPDLLSQAARFATLAKASFGKELLQECLIPYGLDPRAFRKFYREARLELKNRKLEQAMKEVLCS